MNVLSIQNTLTVSIHNQLIARLNSEREIFLQVQRDVERLYDDVTRLQQQNMEETEELKQEFLRRLCDCSRRMNSISFIPEIKEMRKAIKAAIEAANN